MATYLKNTYVDGSLTVEGELKVQNINLDNVQLAALAPETEKRSANRITKFTSSSTQTLQNSVLDSSTYLLPQDYPSAITNRCKDNDNKAVAAQVIVKTEESTGGLPAHYDVLLQTRTSGAKLGSLAYTIGDYSLSLEENAYNPETTANIDGMAVLMVPVHAVHLWNKTDSTVDSGSADNQWHFTEQPTAAVSP